MELTIGVGEIRQAKDDGAFDFEVDEARADLEEVR